MSKSRVSIFKFRISPPSPQPTVGQLSGSTLGLPGRHGCNRASPAPGGQRARGVGRRGRQAAPRLRLGRGNQESAQTVRRALAPQPQPYAGI
eukprot:15457206-Alexandrium_andersonii.AAC.1